LWIVFRDPVSPFLHLDKYVFALVEDKDIHVFRQHLLDRMGGRAYDFDPDVYYLQQFVTTNDDVEFYVRRYTAWTNVS